MSHPFLGNQAHGERAKITRLCTPTRAGSATRRPFSAPGSESDPLPLLFTGYCRSQGTVVHATTSLVLGAVTVVRLAPTVCMTASDAQHGSLPAVALPVLTSKVDLPIYLSPSYLSQPLEGVREQLNRSVLRYVLNVNPSVACSADVARI